MTQLASFLGPFHSVQGAAGAPGTAVKKLAMSIEHAVPSNWCWAAVASAIANFYGGSTSPCEIATKCLKKGDCCTPPTTNEDPRNSEAGIAGALIAIGQTGDNSPWLQFDDLVDEIKSQHPVCCHIEWPSGSVPSGHFLIVVGVDEAAKTVDVLDNQFGDKDGMPYDQLRNGYLNGVGEWGATFLTRKPAAVTV